MRQVVTRFAGQWSDHGRSTARSFGLVSQTVPPPQMRSSWEAAGSWSGLHGSPRPVVWGDSLTRTRPLQEAVAPAHIPPLFPSSLCYHFTVLRIYRYHALSVRPRHSFLGIPFAHHSLYIPLSRESRQSTHQPSFTHSRTNNCRSTTLSFHSIPSHHNTANMHSKIITFAAGALFVLGNAVPLNNGKRDLVWVTEIETAVETIPVTTTVWVDPTGAPEAHGHGHRAKHHKQSQASSAVEVKPTPSPESSSSKSIEQAAYSAPAPAPSSYEAPAYSAPSSVAESTTEAAPSTTAQAQQTTSTPEPAPATTESYVAPVSSYVAPVSSYVAPSSTYEAPSSTYQAPASSSSAAPASYSSSSGSSSGSNPASGKSFTGELTYFTPGMGACGETSGEGDKMVAISQALFDQYTPNGNPNKNPLCGATLTIKGADGAEHKATIWDRCVGCAMADLDMPQEFFDEVTTPSGSSTPADGRAYGYEWSMN